MVLTKQDWALVNDLINVAWGAGAIKNPQMAQGVENLRAKVLEQLEPKPVDEKLKGK